MLIRMCSLTVLHVSNPYLVFMPSLFTPFLNSQDFCLHSFFYTTKYMSVKGGKPPIKINIGDKTWYACV